MDNSKNRDIYRRNYMARKIFETIASVTKEIYLEIERTIEMTQRETLERTFYRDPYNEAKVWEVVKLSGGYYLRQYIYGRQFGKGLRTTKGYLDDIGILGFPEIHQPQE